MEDNQDIHAAAIAAGLRAYRDAAIAPVAPADIPKVAAGLKDLAQSVFTLASIGCDFVAGRAPGYDGHRAGPDTIPNDAEWAAIVADEAAKRPEGETDRPNEDAEQDEEEKRCQMEQPAEKPKAEQTVKVEQSVEAEQSAEAEQVAPAPEAEQPAMSAEDFSAHAVELLSVFPKGDARRKDAQNNVAAKFGVSRLLAVPEAERAAAIDALCEEVARLQGA